jgi:hypothetical protein
MSREFDKTFEIYRPDWHGSCYCISYATNNCCKSLQHKELRQIFGRKFAVSPYPIRLYVEFFVHYGE